MLVDSSSARYIGGLIGGSLPNKVTQELESFVVEGCRVATDIVATGVTDPAVAGVGAVAGLAYLSEVVSAETTGTALNGVELYQIGCTAPLD